MSAEAQAQPLDYTKIADLIRLAGRRFPLVRFSEHELPGLTGRHAMYWALQGVEILFGLAPFTDIAYWRTLSGFAAGRLADLTTQAERESRQPPALKLVSFKTEREQLAWQNLRQSQTLPEPLQEIADIVHLDTGSLSALYAMQRIIKEAESGTLQAEPTQVMTVLARELDFFWKRITRIA
jgi:ABC-type transporter Mla MlaB component